jgi:hypothetical protein
MGYLAGAGAAGALLAGCAMSKLLLGAAGWVVAGVAVIGAFTGKASTFCSNAAVFP